MWFPGRGRLCTPSLLYHPFHVPFAPRQHQVKGFPGGPESSLELPFGACYGFPLTFISEHGPKHLRNTSELQESPLSPLYSSNPVPLSDGGRLIPAGTGNPVFACRVSALKNPGGQLLFYVIPHSLAQRSCWAQGTSAWKV